MTDKTISVCVVGVGPRGLSILERLCANTSRYPLRDCEVHLVDPFPFGAGRVWRTAQPAQLLMNTVASQVTVFTDDSVDCAGPIVPGPSLHEWARLLPFISDQPIDSRLAMEASNLGPDSYSTRALYGCYLEWVARRLIAAAPPGMSIHLHQQQAVALDEDNGVQVVRLADGSAVRSDAVVLALGHADPAAESAETWDLAGFAMANGLHHLAPSNPADVDLTAVRPGEPVIIRGLGLNFFDYLALLTSGRGGRFVRDGDRLEYVRSGDEPVIYVGSRRGVPYHARGENQKGAFGRHEPRFLVDEVIKGFRDTAASGGEVDFRRDVWPLIAKEVEAVYYTALLRRQGQGDREADFLGDYSVHPWESRAEAAVVAEYVPDPALRWNWDQLADPLARREFSGPADFTGWLLDHLRTDIGEARQGNVDSPLKAAVDVLRDLRNEVRLVVDHRGISGDSYRDDLQRWFTPLNAFLSIGPPACRTEELVALVEAGVIEVIGPDITVRASDEEVLFEVYSPRVPDSRRTAAVLVEARLPRDDIAENHNPLLRHLIDTGQARPHTIPNPDGTGYLTGGLDVTPRPYRVVDPMGQPHPRLFALGVPTESVHWVTAAGIRPGVNSVSLGDTDAIARAVLELPCVTSGFMPGQESACVRTSV